jgi:hypothetical protein
MKGQHQSASIYTAFYNARTLCHESGSKITYDDPTFSVAMGMAYCLDQLMSDWAANSAARKAKKNVPSQ